jgi:hypothetical protein
VVEVREDISYELFMAYDVRVRKEIFNRVSADTKARLMATHVDRSLAAYRAKLSPEQIKAIDEVRALITAGAYQEGETAEKRALKESGPRVRAILGEWWAAQFMTLNGIYPRTQDRASTPGPPGP